MEFSASQLIQDKGEGDLDKRSEIYPWWGQLPTASATPTHLFRDMTYGVDIQTLKLEFQTQLPHLIDEYPWASFFISLFLSFLICKIGWMIEPILLAVVGNK